jgi:hypothetical protein
VHTLEFACVCKIGQITPYGLNGNLKPLCQPFDRHLSFRSGDFKDVGMAKSL